MARLLVIEDEAKLRRALERGLSGHGYHVATAADGDGGSRLAVAEPFDCVILDWMLPGRDGLRVLAELRGAGRTTPVLLLTARDAVEDRVTGLDAGANDYLVKPFAFAELLARLRVLLRGRGERETVLHAAGLSVDLLERRAVRGEAELPLSPREFDVLTYLLRHKNHTVTRDMLGREVWREADHALTNVIDVTINTLRRKLERAGLPPLIHTLRGRGYSLRDLPCD
jgi:two-component system copper resistance phosphate regulon response regulator CusR